jgi:hypothetical protein
LGVFTTTNSMEESASNSSYVSKDFICGYIAAAFFALLSHTAYNSKFGERCKNGAWNTLPDIPKEHKAVLIGVLFIIE